MNAQTLLARVDLAEARVAGRFDTLATTAATLEAVVADHPDRYDAVVTLAEVQTERARRDGDSALLADALDRLERATRLDGCGNRVAYLRAKALLVRARLALAEGRDPHRDLESVLAWRDHAASRVPDNEAWRSLIAEAEQCAADDARIRVRTGAAAPAAGPPGDLGNTPSN